MTTRHIFRRAATSLSAVALASGLAACSSASGSGSSGSGGTPTITIGVSGGENAASLPLYYAAQKGVFTKYHVNVKIAELSSDPLAMQGLASGSYPLVFVGAGTAATSSAAGAPAKIVDVPAPLVDYYFLTKKSINSAADLTGKTLGVSGPGSNSALVPLAYLKKQGVDTSKIRVSKIGFDAQRASALIAGKIDGAVANVFVTAGVKSNPNIHVIADLGSQFKDSYMNSVLVASPKSVKNDATGIQRAVTAVIEASRTLWTDKTTFTTFAASQPKLPSGTGEAVYALQHANSTPFYGVDGGMIQTAFDGAVAQLVASGQIPKTVTWAQISNATFVDAAVKQLGKFTS